MTEIFPHRLPGDPVPEQEIARMLRVDHTGEYGATRIYKGQLDVLGRGRSVAVIRRMAEAEQRHLTRFEALLRERRVRPTLLQPLWSVAGYAVGAATALLGERAAMACTIAVEEVIDGHYARQVSQLDQDEAPLREQLERFREDERAHGATARAAGGAELPGYPVLAAAIKAGSRLAIWLSERI